MMHFLFLLAACLWTLDPSHLPPDVPQNELVAILAREGVDVAWVDSEPLWRGTYVTIRLANNPFAPHQMRAEIANRDHWDACTPAELAELYQAVQIARSSLREIAGANGFLVYAKAGNAPGLEVIPCKASSEGVMDAVEKAALNDYFLCGQKRAQPVVHNAKIVVALRTHLQSAKPSIPTENSATQWTQKMTRANGARHYALSALFEGLSQSGSLVNGTVPPPQAESTGVYELRINPDVCAFCNPSIVQKQLVCEWKECVVLFNHKPTNPDGSFLILPKRHQCSWDLTPEEAVSCFEALVGLQKVFSSPDWIFYVQDGPIAGQTVPHTHIHFFPIPSRARLALTGLQHIHNQRKALSENELRATCARFEKSLLFTLKPFAQPSR